MSASIPSPSRNLVEVGPVDIHFYGMLVALGVVIAFVVTTRRYVRLGGDPELGERAAFWAVVIGFLGARAAYVSTHTAGFTGRWWHVIAIWEGGLAMFGGLTAGALTVLFLLWRRGGDIRAFADAVAVALPLAQAVGRWGNYFNQELFGTPSSLPWAVEIASQYRPAEYAAFATFHPAFLYESLWNLVVVVGALLWLERRRMLAPGGLFLAYLGLYGAGRFLLELMRVDTTFRLLGISRNGWVALAIVIGSSVWLAALRRRVPPDEAETVAPPPTPQADT